MEPHSGIPWRCDFRKIGVVKLSKVQIFWKSRIESRIRLTGLLNAQLKKFIRMLSILISNQVELGHSGFRIRNTYFISRNAGLFSLLSTTSSDLLAFNHPITRVSLRFGGDYNKNVIFQNPWLKFFDQNSYPFGLQKSVGALDLRTAWAKDYKALDLESVKPLAGSIFRPSKRVLDLQISLMEKYNLSSEKLIGVHYRGTDKATEIPTTPVEVYVAHVKEILREHPQMEILVQSDSSQALQAFQVHFGEKVKFIEELPLSDNLVGAHTQEKQDRVLDAVTYLAAVSILAKCRYLITHTGNGGLWEFIYRDSLEGFTQISFDSNL